MNILLHAITGLDGANRAIFVPAFNNKYHVNYDLAWLIFLTVTIIFAFALFILIKKVKPVFNLSLP